MRKAFVETVTRLLDEDPRIVVLLGDISVHAFNAAREKHPKRVINCGVNEQAMVSMAAGLARAGMYPIVHTIAPFLVERAFEQLKVDFGYQSLPGCFVSVGASYDYATMGCTHHCPGDVALALTIPEMEVYVPGHPDEVREFLPRIADGAFAYIRLAEDQNESPEKGIASIKPPHGGPALVIAVGPTYRLSPATAQCLYVKRVSPFPVEILRFVDPPKFVLLLEPFYVGTLTHLVAEALPGAAIKSIGVPRRFLRNYGTREEFDRECGLTVENVRNELALMIEGPY